MADDEAVFHRIMTYGPMTVWALARDLRLGVADTERIAARLVERRLLYGHGTDRTGEVRYDRMDERPSGERPRAT